MARYEEFYNTGDVDDCKPLASLDLQGRRPIDRLLDLWSLAGFQKEKHVFDWSTELYIHPDDYEMLLKQEIKSVGKNNYIWVNRVLVLWDRYGPVPSPIVPRGYLYVPGGFFKQSDSKYTNLEKFNKESGDMLTNLFDQEFIEQEKKEQDLVEEDVEKDVEKYEDSSITEDWNVIDKIIEEVESPERFNLSSYLSMEDGVWEFTCPDCGAVEDLELVMEIEGCDNCGLVIDMNFDIG